MYAIAESNVLLRDETVFPEGCKVATEEFHGGWRVMRSGGARRLERKVRARGWSLNRQSDGELRSGVGSSAQAAIARALALGLRRLEPLSHAVEVDHVEVTKYPWFFLARVSLLPYSIQPEGADTVGTRARQESAAGEVSASQRAGSSHNNVAGGMPMLKAMLTSV